GLIADLDADKFLVRERAAAELHKLGDVVEQALRNALVSNPPLERRRRLEDLLTRVNERGDVDAARIGYVLRVLEALHTPAAIEALESLAMAKNESWLKRRAAETLERIKR